MTLLARDRKVLAFARQQRIPLAWVLAGGYTEDVRKVVQVHLSTFEAWRETHDRSGERKPETGGKRKDHGA
jgi:hypothetical protein